jgi:hypothetical protein
MEKKLDDKEKCNGLDFPLLYYFLWEWSSFFFIFETENGYLRNMYYICRYNEKHTSLLFCSIHILYVCHYGDKFLHFIFNFGHIIQQTKPNHTITITMSKKWRDIKKKGKSIKSTGFFFCEVFNCQTWSCFLFGDAARSEKTMLRRHEVLLSPLY